MLPLVLRIGLALFFLSQSTLNAQTPAVQGVVDLRDWNGQETRLDGEWIFYPNELLSPESYLQRLDSGDQGTNRVKVGLSFQEVSRGSMENLGYGTYVLQLKNIPYSKPLGLGGIEAYTAFQAFLFNRASGLKEPALIAGQVSQSRKDAVPKLSSSEVARIPDEIGSEAFILIQVSNFHHQWGGLWVPPRLGFMQDLLSRYQLELKRNYLAIGILIMSAIYNFSLYSRRREDKGSFLLGLLSLMLILRSMGYLGQIDDIFQDALTNFNVTFKLIYISMILAPILILHFVLDYFPRQAPGPLKWWLTWLSTPMMLFFALTDPLIFTPFGVITQYFGITLGALGMFILIRALIAGESGAKISCAGFLAVFAGGVLDMMSAAGVYQFPTNCLGHGLVIFTLAQSQVIGVRFAAAFRKANHLGKVLQLEVDRQTREIKSIMQSIELGIFTVVDEDLRIGDQFSTHLKTLTQRDDIQGRSLDTILFANAKLTSDKRDQALSVLRSSINSDLLNFEMNTHCLPQELIIQVSGSGGEQVWELDWTPIVNKQDIIEKVLVCVRDVTDILRLKEKARDQESHLAIINELILVAEDRFSRFLSTSQTLIRENQVLLDTHSAESQTVLRQLFMNMHTLKGMARTYHFAALSAAAHHAEQCLSELQGKPGSWPIEIMKADLKLVSQTLETYEHFGRTRLGWNLGQRILRIHKTRLEGMLDDLQALPLEVLDPGFRARIKSVENRLGSECYRHFRDVILDACKGSDSLARNLGKQPPQIAIDPDDIFCRDLGADLIHAVFTHLLRNILDHGLETPDERKAVGKSPEGNIMIRARHDTAEVCLTIQDDGRGLNLDRIETLGREKGSIAESESWTDEQIAELIFQASFSTAREVTEISGRGVGMDAVRSYLQKQGGRIAIRFTAPRKSGFRSFAFVISIPDRLCWFPHEMSQPETSGSVA
jgi:HPt (histidine-containing phosphotransfer) domain-containing protein